MPEATRPATRYAGESGSEFADEGEGDDVTGEGGLAETNELGTGLQHHDGADEEASGQDDRERANADVVHLIHEVAKIAWAGEEIGERLHGHEGVSLDVGEEATEGVAKHLDHRDALDGLGVVFGYLEGSIWHDSLSLGAMSLRLPLTESAKAA